MNKLTVLGIGSEGLAKLPPLKMGTATLLEDAFVSVLHRDVLGLTDYVRLIPVDELDSAFLHVNVLLANLMARSAAVIKDVYTEENKEEIKE